MRAMRDRATKMQGYVLEITMVAEIIRKNMEFEKRHEVQ